jgi:hypothetical protein
MSVHFELNMDVEYIHRKSYDLLNMGVEIGGVLKVLMIIFSLIASPFAVVRIEAIITSRLFHLSMENKQEIFGELKLSKNDRLSDYNLHTSETGEILFGIPRNLTYDYVIYLCCLCCKRETKFSKYK